MTLPNGKDFWVWGQDTLVWEWVTGLDTGWHVALLLGVLLLCVLAYSRWRRFLAWWRRSRRFSRAQWGEEAAARLLRSEGYRVLASQVREHCEVLLDDETIAFSVQADYLVARRGMCYVAEVKTGESAPSVRNANTRRQLLEYSKVFDCDGVLLVDMETRTIHRVCFKRLGSRKYV